MTATLFKRLGAIIILLWLAVGLAGCSNFAKGDNRHNQPLSGGTVQGLRNMGSGPDRGMVVRIFKEEAVLEIWKQTAGGTYRLFKTYEICAYSGDLGPKFAEGDRQSPEGFYTITPGLMNPRSSYYLSFNTGFPNKFDRAHGRTGSDLMVHGDCSSRGCYAMTDDGIAEIYALARETFKGGNPSFQLQIFPFRMTTENLARHASNPHMGFWNDIKEGYDYFDVTKTPPVWDVCEQQYIFNPIANGPIDPMGPCPPVQQNAALLAKQASDATALANHTAAVEQAAAQTQAQELAMQQRGEAMSGFFSNIGGALGVGGGAAPGQDPSIQPVMTGEAPVALPAPVGTRP